MISFLTDPARIPILLLLLTVITAVAAAFLRESGPLRAKPRTRILAATLPVAIPLAYLLVVGLQALFGFDSLFVVLTLLLVIPVVGFLLGRLVRAEWS